MRQRLAGNSALQDLASQQKNLLNLQIRRLRTDTPAAKRGQRQTSIRVGEGSKRSHPARGAGAEQGVAGPERHQPPVERGAARRYPSDRHSDARQYRDQQQTEHLTQIDKALEQQIEVLEGSLLLSRILHQQKSELPRVKTDKNLADQIADLRLRQFELNQLTQSLA